MKYNIILIENDLAKLFPNNPFNLKKDFKSIGIRHKDIIIQELAEELRKGFNRKECSKLYYIKTNDVYVVLAKIRIKLDDKGKKTSLRCILIIDENNNLYLVLHIYEKKNKSNISKFELNSAKNLLDFYYNELIKEYRNE